MLHVDGSCHCEKIKFEAELDASKATICHCTDCQQLTGAPFRVVVPVAKEHFKLLQGEPKTYLKIAESGNRRLQAFCPDCGTSIYATMNSTKRSLDSELEHSSKEHKSHHKNTFGTAPPCRG